MWNTRTGQLIQEFKGHRDAVHAVALSPSDRILATASYDKTIILWDTESGKPLRTLTGHNGAVYDVAFDPAGKVIASASGDDTVKLWNVATGERLDTLSQPLAEQFTVTFSPDGKYVVAGGADNRIRVWEFLSKETAKINPLVYSRFAHEEPIVDLEFSAGGDVLLSASEDRTLKQWETDEFSQVFAWDRQADVAVKLAVAPDSQSFVAALMDGSLKSFEIRPAQTPNSDAPAPARPASPLEDAPLQKIVEQEPNDRADQASLVTLPVTISGTIHADDESRATDTDVFRFYAHEGEQWMMEVDAAQSDSPLDSRIDVLTVDGERIERILLEAVRDSWFTFRGKDSMQSDDFRVHNWEEMELNEYLYANGEVVRLWLYPRGPDSGFRVYPGRDTRYGYFGTTAATHALNSPCYVVRPHPPGTKLIAAGLPVFPIYYENDDDSRREIGTDSRLIFTAPHDGDFLVRLSDARGFQGDRYDYKLTVRHPRPRFSVSVDGMNPKVNPGTGREFSVTAQRIDGFDGPIQVEIGGLPPGFQATTPLVIQAGQNTALGSIVAARTAPAPTDKNNADSTISATAVIAGQRVDQDCGSLGKIQLGESPKIRVIVETSGALNEEWSMERPLKLRVRPGATIVARVRIERHGFDGEVSFGKDDSGRNLPHGVYIDNIGLSGLTLREGQTQRDIFITAANWVPATTRTFHLLARVEGNITSLPVILHVESPTIQVSRGN